MAGTVEELTFRVTKLRDASGILHIIPNSAITRVSNYTRGHMQAVINIPVAYEADIDKVIALLEEAAREIGRMPEVQEGPKVIGVVDLRPGEVIVRVVAKTVPLEQVKVEAAYRHKTRVLFEQAKIPVPELAPRLEQEGKK
jgi:small conductance mechanosensitive channel